MFDLMRWEEKRSGHSDKRTEHLILGGVSEDQAQRMGRKGQLAGIFMTDRDIIAMIIGKKFRL